MESRIKDLLKKYWDGTSTLGEEKKLRQYFSDTKNLSPESKYFQRIEEKREVEMKFSHPGKNQKRTWMSLAASISIGILVAFIALNDARNQDQFTIEDPKEAYELTKQALLMIGSTINEGGNYSKELNKINKAKTVISESKKSNK